MWCVWRRLGSLPSGRPRKEKSATWHVCHSRLMKALVVGEKMQAAVKSPTKSSPTSVTLGTQRVNPRNASRPSAPLHHTGMVGHNPGPRNAAAAAALAQEVEIVHGPRIRRVQQAKLAKPPSYRTPPAHTERWHSSYPLPSPHTTHYRLTEIRALIGTGGRGNQLTVAKPPPSHCGALAPGGGGGTGPLVHATRPTPHHLAALP